MHFLSLKTKVFAACGFLGLVALGCQSHRPPLDPSNLTGSAATPLGPSYVLIPLPTEDEDLLGRILPSAPEPGRSLEETARPNPCADKLAPAKTSPLASTFEDAHELSSNAKVKATLGMFGFEGDVSNATHFYYRLATSRRTSRTDTNEYVTCCKEANCGYGYVSALVYGDGEYATGTSNSAGAGVDIAIASAEGQTKLKVLHRRRVKGWLAAIVTVTEQGQKDRLGPLGLGSSELVEETPSTQVLARYLPEKVTMRFMRNGNGEQTYLLMDGQSTLTENEFIRRYRNVTGGSELDSAEVRRNTGTVITLGLLTLGATAGTVWGFQNASGKDEKGAGGIIVASMAGSTALIVGGSFLYFLFNKDGGLMDHTLTANELTPRIRKYNKAILQRTMGEVQRANQGNNSGFWLRPNMGMQGGGINAGISF